MSTTLLEIPGYRVHGQLGKGGMAEVFLATQESLSRKVAIKVLRSAEDETFSQRFIKEAHIVASLNHPSIITIYDIMQVTPQWGQNCLAVSSPPEAPVDPSLK